MAYENRWRTQSEIEKTFGFKPALLEYLGILNAINIEWRRGVKETIIYPGIVEDEFKHNIEKVLLMKKVR